MLVVSAADLTRQVDFYDGRNDVGGVRLWAWMGTPFFVVMWMGVVCVGLAFALSMAAGV